MEYSLIVNIGISDEWRSSSKELLPLAQTIPEIKQFTKFYSGGIGEALSIYQNVQIL